MVMSPSYAVLSRVKLAMRGGSQKVTNDDEGEGVTIPPKIDDVIYEQPQIALYHLVFAKQQLASTTTSDLQLTQKTL